MNAVNIFLSAMLIIIIALQLFGVNVSQRAINITYGFILLLFVVANSGWLHL